MDFVPPVLRKKKKRKKIEDEQGFGTGDGEEVGVGGAGTNDNEGGDNTGQQGFGSEGGGKGKEKYKKINKSKYFYKCYQKSGESKYVLAISSNNQKTCNIGFFAQGIESRINESIRLGEVKDVSTGETLKTNNNFIIGAELDDEVKEFEISLISKRRFGVEVELYA